MKKLILAIAFVIMRFWLNAQSTEDVKSILVRLNEVMSKATEYSSELKMSIYTEGSLLSESVVKVVKNQNRTYTVNGLQETLSEGDIRIVADHSSKTLVYGEVIHLGQKSKEKSEFVAQDFMKELEGKEYTYSNIVRRNGNLEFDIMMKNHGVFKSIFISVNETSALLHKIDYTYSEDMSVDHVELVYTRNELQADARQIPLISHFIKGKGRSATAQKDFKEYRFINQANS